MRPVSESRVILISAVTTVIVLLIFVLSLGAVLLVSRSRAGTDPNSAATAAPSREPVAAATASLSTPPPPSATPVQGAAIVTRETSELAAATAPTAPATPTAPPPTATVEPTATMAPPTPPHTATPAPSQTPVPSPTPAPSQTSAPSPTPAPSPTVVEVASLHWPEDLPDGMTFAVEDSWPFRTIASDRAGEPFLIFRGGERWLLIRNQAGDREPVPRSATTQTLQIAGAPATLIKYLGGGFKLLLERDGRTMQMSGQLLPDEDITSTAASLRLLSAEALRTRLTQAAAGQTFHVTFLWPDFVPDGIALAPAETILQIAQPAAGPAADRYLVSFRGPNVLIQIGGGSADPPSFPGAEERITAGSLTGLLTTAEQRYLLVVDAGAAGGNVAPIFPASSSDAPQRLPLVQQGRVYIATEGIDRDQFDRIVANLVAVQPQAFTALAHGQQTSDLTYLWPSTLPDGYTIDLSTVQIAWDDFLLQGGRPFFQLIATGPDGGAVSINGGRESSGQPFIVPEGGGVQRSIASIHGQVASAAQSPDGAVLVWSEYDALYAINSRSLGVEQLIAIGEGLGAVTDDDFLRRIQ